MSSIEVRELAVQLDGSVIPGSLATGYTPKPLNDGFEIGLGDIDGAYQVKYTTRITGTQDATYTNKAVVTGDNLDTPLEKSANVEVRYSKPLDKKALHYDAPTQTITWSIQYNYNERKIAQSDAWLKDAFDKKQLEFVDGSFEIYEMAIKDNGSAVRKTGKPLIPGTDYILDTKAEYGFHLSFKNEVTSAYEIIYKTKASGRIYDESVAINNKVEMYDGHSKETGRNIGQVIFDKSAGNVDYANKTIEWTLSLNKDQQEMKNVVIRDDIKGQGMTFLPDTLHISGLELNKDYTVKPDPSYKEAFVIEFKNPVKKHHYITYKTKFNFAEIQNKEYRNRAVLTWEDEKGPHEIEKSAIVRPDNYTTGNGNKTGEYNAVTKEITWTIDVNYNLHQIGSAVIRDFYTGGQTFVEDSLTVHHLTLTGGRDGVELGAEVPKTGYTFQKQTENGLDGLEIKLGAIDSAYRITYKTSLQGPVAAEYKNHAAMWDESNPDQKIFEKSAVVKPKFGGEFLNKTGKQGTGADQDFAFWQLSINRSQSHLEPGAEVTDTLSGNQILVKDSFKLYATIVDPSGSLRKGGLADPASYKLDIGETHFKLTFVNALDTAYILEYQSFINAEDGENIDNNAKFSGKSIETVEDSDQEVVIVRFSGAGGGANSPGKGDLKIVKVDAGSKKPLAGAKFGLYDASGANLLKELVTDEQGRAVFEGVKYKNYILKELSAPSGYVIDQAYLKGKLIKFAASSKEFTVENEKGTWNLELTKIDRDQPSKGLEGAVFKLQYDNGSGFADVIGYENLTTDASGKILLSKLQPGKYQLVEIKAPKGYKLNSTPIPFTIEPNQTTVKTISAPNESYVGSVELVKVDKDSGASLAGAQFELRDGDGYVLLTGLTTDKEGKLFVDQLKAGKYQFAEISAPNLYVVNPEPLKFEIVNDVKLEVIFENERMPGSLKLTKVEKGYPDKKLQGAEFRILDAKQSPVKDKDGKELAGLVTDENGVLHVEGLKPGQYYVEETKAPAGYIRDSKPILIEIQSGQETPIRVENIRYTGGEGGTTPPNPEPPTGPNPEPPVGPQSEQPGEPTTPGNPNGPTTPTDPNGETGEPGDPDGAVDPLPPPPAKEQENKPGKPGKPSKGSNDDPKKNDNGQPSDGGNQKNNLPSGPVLPKTGEESQLLYQLIGYGSILLGAALLLVGRKRKMNS
ncbi:SpaA isopeptide-forming pilin-related protein [Paenibacillus sp. DMB20]|uniref:SpaA isopeptide-forming pilin-related protein n=1 Tax=Paenibacillus sp. DMB20 TaxID=1642570 RepID=UPI000627850D|nr:SpaA isopeptide-forming pilin-related protein [Paenibacillus sp. DMB20]KKO51068.1 hypothetical protein XI25_29125 [Paenibacillus sp. DMB20]